MKTKLLVLTLTILLATVGIATLQVETVNNAGPDFIVFSDTHVGRGIGSDNMTAGARYQMLIQNTNQVNAKFLVNIGDLVDGSSNGNQIAAQYDLYNNISQTSNKPVLAVKGNHDRNNTVYSYMVGSMNWIRRYDDVLAVGIGCVAEGDEWTNGVSYDQATMDFLNWTVNSQEYAQTTYHFLFEHFPPNITWPCGDGKMVGIPNSTWTFYPDFNIVFCGHEGGIEWTTNFQDTLIVKTAHLGDGKVPCDTYLTVTVNRGENITVVSNNFVTGYKYTLCTLPLKPYKATVTLQDYDMDTAKEFRVIVNGKTAYVCPSNSSNNNVWITWQLGISQYMLSGTNTVTFANPIIAYNKIRNLTITVNNSTVVSDATVHVLQNSSWTYTFQLPLIFFS